MTTTRWCPSCGGAKRPSQDICQACGITRDLRAQEHDDPDTCGTYDRCKRQRERDAAAAPTHNAAIRARHRAYND